MKTRSVQDSRFAGLDVETLNISDRTVCRRWVEQALDDRVGTIVVIGDDATLAALATAYLEDLDRAEPLEFALLTAGHLHTAAVGVSAPVATSRSLRRLTKQLDAGRHKTVLLGTLRVVDSMNRSARLGFSFGLGSATQLLTGDSRPRRRDAVKRAIAPADMVQAEVFVDWQATCSSFGYLIASSLPHTAADIAMGDALAVRVGDSVMGLVGGSTRVGRVIERATGGRAIPFRRIHIDTNNDYVVDGVSSHSSKPRIVAVEAGPRVRVLAPS